MITKTKYEEWAKDSLNSGDDADYEVEAKKAQVKYEELTSEMTVTIITHDWKDYANHLREVSKKVSELGATTMHHFPAFHELPHGSLDSIITVVSKEKITEEFAEILADLVMNLGAEGS